VSRSVRGTSKQMTRNESCRNSRSKEPSCCRPASSRDTFRTKDSGDPRSAAVCGLIPDRGRPFCRPQRSPSQTEASAPLRTTLVAPSSRGDDGAPSFASTTTRIRRRRRSPAQSEAFSMSRRQFVKTRSAMARRRKKDRPCRDSHRGRYRNRHPHQGSPGGSEGSHVGSSSW